ncbi:cytochrome p450 domain-containing protein [Ditylenchus destructor]|nr:cytochrome p450 domain-containing protein [Ditylenchus destructor]
MVLAVGEKLAYLAIASFIAVKFLPLHWSIVVIAGIFAAFYWYAKFHYGYWKRLGFDGPNPNILVGTTFDLSSGFFAADARNKKRYGKTYGAYTFGRIELVTQDLEILRHVLVKDFECFATRPDIFRLSFGNMKESIVNQGLADLEGEEWRRVRYAVTPAFTSLKMRTIIPILNVCCKQLEKVIDSYIDSNEPIPLKDVLGRMTLDMIAKAGFALDVDTYDRTHESPFVHHSKEFFKQLKFVGLRTFISQMFPNFGVYAQKFTGIEFAHAKYHEFFQSVLEELYDRRKKEADDGKTYNDLFQLLLSAVNEELTSAEKEQDAVIMSDAHKIGAAAKRRDITKIQLIAQGFALMVAGYDTSATTLEFALYNLAKLPEIQDQLRDEIDSVVGDDEEMTYEHLTKMPYLYQVIQETLRMYSPVPRIARLCRAPTKICGIEFKPGMQVSVPITAIHYDPGIYPDPYQFNPDRFSAEEKRGRDPLTWLPFGYGARNCIGMRLAEFEVKIALAFLIRRYRFTAAEGSPNLPIEVDTKAMLKPLKELCVMGEKI